MKEDFEKNAFKSHLQPLSKLDTLDALMQVSLCGIKLENIDSRVVFKLWRNTRNQRILSLD